MVKNSDRYSINQVKELPPCRVSPHESQVLTYLVHSNCAHAPVQPGGDQRLLTSLDVEPESAPRE